MKKICLSFSVVALALVFSGCSKKNSAPSNSASVMFVNGCQGASNINILVNNAKVNNATGIPFFGTSGYQYITAGSGVTISSYLTSPYTPLASQTPNITANTHYSVFTGGIITSPFLLLTTDDLTAPGSNNAKIRLVNLSPDDLNETASVGDSTFATNISVNTASAFYIVAAGAYVVKSVDVTNVSTAVSTNSMLLAAGKIYTAVLTGSQAGSGSTALTLTIINNN